MQSITSIRSSLTVRLGGLLGALLLTALVVWTLLLHLAGCTPGSLPGVLAGAAVFAGAVMAPMVVLLHRRVTLPIRRLVDVARMLIRGEPIRGPEVAADGDLRHLYEAFQKVSRLVENKRSALQREHSEYLNLFESVPCLITVQDRNLRLIRYNREFAEKFAPRDGDFCYSVYKGRDTKCPDCPVEKTFQDGRSHVFEEAGRNREGRFIHWLARTAPIRDKDGNVVAAMELSLDVTASRQLEAKLKASERRYAAIFNNIPNPVFVLDPKTMRILDCNDSVNPVYGYTRDELLGRLFLDLFDEREREQTADQIKTGIFLHQVRQRSRDGRRLFVDIRASLTPYPEWELLLVTTSDITQQIETEQQLIQASKMTTLGEMATGVAHELNQPLSVMKTASSFMLKKFDAGRPVNPEIFGNMLRKIDANVDRATNIIQHMRQFARKSEVDLEPVDINQTLQMALEIFSEQLKLRGIRIDQHLTPKLPLVQANPSRLEQVFINLMLNARDAIEERWADKQAAPENKVITLRTRTQDDWVLADVCDTGSGILPSLMDKIFEPFFTTKTVGKGTGLGLSISYGIVRQCGGQIRAENRPGGGACFRLCFPIDTRTQGAKRLP